MNIVVTGASSGIGQIIAKHLSELGHQVIGTSRYQEGQFDNYELLKLDVTSDDSVSEFIENLSCTFPYIDVLINNAGYVVCGSIENTSIVEAKMQFETNYFGVIRVTQKLLPQFRAQNKGKIINICSMAGKIGMPFQAHYSASKFALEGFTEALRLELSPLGIQVCNINPGDFKTGITANRKIAKQIDEAYQQNFKSVLDKYEKEERNGSDPIQIAKLIAILIRQSNLKVRYTVGKTTQTSAILLKRIFGAQLFEKVMKMMWKIK
jgi:short-subunit dehydrogenase